MSTIHPLGVFGCRDIDMRNEPYKVNSQSQIGGCEVRLVMECFGLQSVLCAQDILYVILYMATKTTILSWNA
jgi:hypothetical protein